MQYIEPHIHMVSRITDDYQRMAWAGCVAVTEPAFWPGFDRTHPEGFYDYFCQLTQYEPQRAARFGIDHYCWLCINPKEAEDPAFARQVMDYIPQFIDQPNVLGIGEIGLNKNTKNELAILDAHIQLAMQYDQLILVHTPHLEDKLKGTKLIIDALHRHGSVRPERVLIDHVEEHTINLVLKEGFWAGMTLYPNSKCTPQRAADMVEQHGSDRLMVNSAGDWGPSDPMSVPQFRLEMQSRGHASETIGKLTFHNPARFFSQCPKFKTPDITASPQ
jgi:predicted metal-dependent TIM-barrel fold hydrolase